MTITSATRHIIALCVLAGSVSCLWCDESRASEDWIVFDFSSRNISSRPVNIPNRTIELHLEKNAIKIVPEVNWTFGQFSFIGSVA